MKHDIRNYIRDYKRITDGRREPFHLSDIDQIYELSRTDAGRVDTATAIINALAAGYALGYKAAKAQKNSTDLIAQRK